MNSIADEEPRTYVVRFRERARREIYQAVAHFIESAGDDTAIEWHNGLTNEMAALSQFPRRCPRVPEQFTREVRQLVYRRGRGRAAYRVLFTLTNEEPDALEPPTVTVIHIRHAAVRPMTRREIREIEAERE